MPTGPQPVASLRLSLMAYAYFLEHEGRLEEALEVLALAVRTHGPEVPAADFAASALFAGRLNRLLARWNEATNCYHLGRVGGRAGGRPGAGAPRPGSAAARCSAARATCRSPGPSVEVVIEAARAAELRDVQAMALTDLGCGLLARGPAGSRWSRPTTRPSASPKTRCSACGSWATSAWVSRSSAPWTAPGWRSRSSSARGRASWCGPTPCSSSWSWSRSTGNRMAFERRRAEAEKVRDRMPPSMLADLHYKAGVGLARFGQIARARHVLTAGLELSETHQLNAWYFRFERILDEPARVRSAASPTPPDRRTWVSLPAVQAVAVGLREYASAD